MKKILKIKYIVLLALILMYSCETEDFTGYSTLVPTKPTITLTGMPANINFVEKDSVFTINAAMSVTQIVDVVVTAKKIAGTATEGEDFKILNDGGKVTFTAGSKTGVFRIQVLSDDIKEKTETFTIQFGDETTANATLTPATLQFTIQNATSDELSAEMSWATDIESAIGISKDPDEVVDLRLLIMKESDKSLVAVEDGASFETFADFNSLPDGSYLVGTDIYSTINAGDFNAPVTLDIDLAFFQPGTLDTLLSFPKVMDNLMPCDDYFTILAKVVKAGGNYTISKNVSYAWSADLADLAGTWYGKDNWDYPTQIVTAVSGSDLTIDGIGFAWMEDAWGEAIQSHTPVKITFDWNSSGKITIDRQYSLTTTYDGDPYEYDVVGEGSFITCGDYPVLILQYDIVYTADGWSIGEWAYDNGYMDTPYFTTTISLDPNYGKGAKSMVVSGTRQKISNKPKR